MPAARSPPAPLPLPFGGGAHEYAMYSYDDAAFFSPGCADGCDDTWVDDSECDEMCNVPSCRHDGDDCSWGAGECYIDKDGRDYRGAVNLTSSGVAC